MASRTPLLVAVSVLAIRLAMASGPFEFCTDNECGNCPVQVTDAGTGYPNCVVYSTEDVFGQQTTFQGSPSGGYAPFINVPQPAEGCQVIIRSPASTTIEGCGFPQGAYANAVCSTLDLDTTFMVQFCCGTGDCKAAGVEQRRSAKFGAAYLESRGGGGGGGGAYLYHANGTRIEPMEEGSAPLAGRGNAAPTTRSAGQGSPEKQARSKSCPPATQARKRGVNAESEQREGARRGLSERKCKPKNWQPAGDSYTRPAENTQIVATPLDGGSFSGQVTISETRSQTWSETEGADLGFSDVLSLGVSFSEETSCEISDSKSYTFNVGSGEEGNVGFTAFLSCQQGTYDDCDGNTSDVIEVCAPYKNGDGTIAGIYGLIVSN
ncbi:hypothetical protein GGR56DRAFT_657719 [Xylariaceae sp. FL0804]|nr:hypothetical protein GGR56DRAFT_657719 [Xylariaceae sp. FL0804]